MEVDSSFIYNCQTWKQSRCPSVGGWINKVWYILTWLPRWLSCKESACHVDLASVSPWVGKISWRREWLPTPVFLPGEFHGQKSLVGYSPWGWEEYDTPEQTNNQNSDFEYHGTFYRSKLKQVSGVH